MSYGGTRNGAEPTRAPSTPRGLRAASTGTSLWICYAMPSTAYALAMGFLVLPTLHLSGASVLPTLLLCHDRYSRRVLRDQAAASVGLPVLESARRAEVLGQVRLHLC